MFRLTHTALTTTAAAMSIMAQRRDTDIVSHGVERRQRGVLCRVVFEEMIAAHTTQDELIEGVEVERGEDMPRAAGAVSGKEEGRIGIRERGHEGDSTEGER